MSRFLFNGGPEDITGYCSNTPYIMKSGESLEVFDTYIQHQEQNARGTRQMILTADYIAKKVANQFVGRGIVVLGDGVPPEAVPKEIRARALQSVSEHLETVPENFEQMNIEREIAKSMAIKRDAFVADRKELKKKVDADLKALMKEEKAEAREAARVERVVTE